MTPLLSLAHVLVALGTASQLLFLKGVESEHATWSFLQLALILQSHVGIAFSLCFESRVTTDAAGREGMVSIEMLSGCVELEVSDYLQARSMDNGLLTHLILCTVPQPGPEHDLPRRECSGSFLK